MSNRTAVAGWRKTASVRLSKTRSRYIRSLQLRTKRGHPLSSSAAAFPRIEKNNPLGNIEALCVPDYGSGSQLHSVLHTVEMSADGEDVLQKKYVTLMQHLKDAYELTPAQCETVSLLLEHQLLYYKIALIAQLEEARRMHSASAPAEDDSAFVEVQHLMRRTNKLLARTRFLRARGDELEASQKAFLRSSSSRLSALVSELAERPASRPQVPVYKALYDQRVIEGLSVLLSDIMDLSADQVPEMYMLLARQLVVFAKLDASITSPTVQLKTAVELDHEFKYGTGCFIIQGLFSEDDMNKTAFHIDQIHARQAQGVRHFASGSNASKRVWDLLQNDSQDGVFRQQVTHPVLAAINSVVLGSEWRVGSLAVNETVPGSDAQDPHIDYPNWRKFGHNVLEFPKSEGGSKDNLTMQGCVAYEPFTAEVGATGIVLGSQHWGVYPHSQSELDEYYDNETVATMDKGDYLVFNPNCQHRSRKNVTMDRTRKAGIFQFVAGYMQPMEVAGARVKQCIREPQTFEDHYLRKIHTYPYPDDLVGQAGTEQNTTGASRVISGHVHR